MVGGSADPAFDVKFREFLMEPGTQEVIASDQAKELGIMRETVLTRSHRVPQPCRAHEVGVPVPCVPCGT